MSDKNVILNVENLCVNFHLKNKNIAAVQNVSFQLLENEIIAIVGESGSGKSVSTLALLKLLPSYAQITADTMFYKNININTLSEAQIQNIRGKEIAYIPQEPSSAYDPLFTIRATFAETLRLINPKITKAEIEKKAVEVLHDVGIDDAKNRLDSFFHQFSGGMIQRVMIALALCLEPSIIIADEPTTALDVVVQKKVVNILTSLNKKYSHSLIFISHDIALVSQFAQRILVMKDSRIVEHGSIENVLQKPQHEYTKHLLSSVITLDTPASHNNGVYV